MTAWLAPVGLVFVSSLLVISQTALAQVPSSWPYSDVVRAGRPEPQFASHLDSVAKAVGLPPLRRVELPPDYGEIRLWDGFGIAGPFSFLRIVTHGSLVRGQMFKWGPLPSSDGSLEEIRGSAEILRRYWRCYDATTSHGIEWCVVKFPAAAGWSRVLDRLEEHRVWSLPQKEHTLGWDGFTLVAEILIGAEYRTYDYWIYPGDDPDENDAAAIHGLVFGTLDEEFGIEDGRVGIKPDRGCDVEGPRSRAFILKVLNGPQGEEIREGLGNRFLGSEELVLIRDDAECRRRNKAWVPWFDLNLKDYSILHYDLGTARLIVKLGAERSEAKGCLDATLLTGDRYEQMNTVCFLQ